LMSSCVGGSLRPDLDGDVGIAAAVTTDGSRVWISGVAPMARGAAKPCELAGTLIIQEGVPND